MSNRPDLEKSIFLRAIEKSVSAERAAFLDQACAGDPELRAAVDALLAAHDQPQAMLDVASRIEATVDQPAAERPGSVIGPYKLMEQIGEGGMGLVYIAEQQHPVRRKVALKLIKPGMDTREVIARFEAERQALALMDHPNIAKVLDASATASGRPYFVMELVKGVPITQYCDENRLTPNQRLELFLHVCQAVQHAHQKGIIHRDIKPTNVLVASHDGTPVVKVIDFGVAKAIGQQLTEKTIYTGVTQMVGTPLYMSPEQAGMSSLDVDTRTDIYSLGVLLYELLTGTTPFDKERLKKAAFDEIRRIIREEEPPKPSTRLSESSDSLPSISALRHTEPAKLTKLVRGDLDWIVMKALDKDRTRRYETASGLLRDVKRYLDDEPVEAGPPSATYRFRKFARRNRAALIAATALALVFLLGVAGLAVSNRLIARERDAKDTALVTARKAEAKEARERRKAQRQTIETERQRKLAEENYRTAREAVDRMLTRAAEDLRDKPQMDAIRRELLEEALKFYQRFLKQRSKNPTVYYETAMSQRRVGEIQGYLGDPKKSLEHHVQSVEMLRNLCERSPGNRQYRDQLARALFHAATASFTLVRLEEGDATMNEAIAIWEALVKDSPNQGPILENLAWAYAKLGRFWSANYYAKGRQFTARSQQILAQLRQEFPKQEIQLSFKRDLEQIDLWRFVALPHDPALLEQLEQECRERLAAAEREAAAHPDVPDHLKEVERWIARLSASLFALDKLPELEELCRRNVEINERLVSQHQHVDEYRVGLGWAEYHYGLLLFRTGRNPEATEQFRTAIGVATALLDKHPDVIRYYSHLKGMIELCPVHELRDLPRAVELGKRMMELGGGSWSDLAFAEVRAGRYTEGLESARKAAAAKENPALVAITEAIAAWHTGKQEEARQRVRQVVLELDTVPNNYWYQLQYRLLRIEIEQMMGIEPLKSADAEEILRESISLFEKRAVEFPAEPWHREQAALRWRDVAETLGKTPRAQEAAEAYRQSKATFEKLATDFPREASYRDGLIHAYRLLTSFLISSGQRPAAEQTYADAISVFSKLAQDNPDVAAYGDMLARTHHELGALQAQSGQTGEAEKNHRQAIAIWSKLGSDVPSEPSYRAYAGHVLTYYLTSLLETSGRAAESEQTSRQAIVEWEKLVAEYPADSEYRRQLGETYGVLTNILTAADRLPEAELTCTEAIEKWPDTASLFVARARTYMASQQPDKALVDFSKAIEIGGIAWWHLERSGAYRALKQDDKALADLSLAVETWPALWDTWVWRGNFHNEFRHWDEALADYSRAVELHATNWQIWSSRGLVAARLGRWDQAIESYERALALNPESPYCHNDLAWLLATCPVAGLRNPARAVEVATKTVELESQAGAFWNTLAVAQYRATDWNAALEALNHSIELRGDTAAAWYFLAMVHWQLDQHDEARKWFDQASEWLETNAPQDEELRRFQAEAAGLLGAGQEM